MLDPLPLRHCDHDDPVHRHRSNGSLGNYIQIDHGNGYVTGYAHLQNGGIGVRIGQSVGPGQNIGAAGTTGLSTGCHLHLILRENGTPIDPLAFLRNQGVVFG